MYSFIFMNVACLLTQTKSKNEVLSDRSTLFLCIFHNDIINSVFTKQNPDMIVTNRFSFFHTQSSMDEDNELYLTNILLSEKFILKLYMNCPPVQQQDQMVFHLHYWSTALLN